jgi:GMP synthase (glutamine-hydrolysing)
MRYGARTYAFQFHGEVTRNGFRRWQDRDRAPWGMAGVQSREEQDRLGVAHDPGQHAWFMGFLARLFGSV